MFLASFAPSDASLEPSWSTSEAGAVAGVAWDEAGGAVRPRGCGVAERSLRLEEQAEAERARRSREAPPQASTHASTPGAPHETPQVAAELEDAITVLDAIDDLIAAVVQADDLAFSVACEALHARVVGTGCLAALAARRLGRVVRSRWLPALTQVTCRRGVLGARLTDLLRALDEPMTAPPPRREG